MQITLNQEEIETALIAYVRSTISIADNYEIAVDLKAGRGEHGYAATLDITPAKVRAAAPKKTTTLVRPRAVVEVQPETDPEPELETEVESDQEEVADETSATAEASETEEAKAEDAPKPASIFNFGS